MKQKRKRIRAYFAIERSNGGLFLYPFRLVRSRSSWSWPTESVTVISHMRRAEDFLKQPRADTTSSKLDRSPKPSTSGNPQIKNKGTHLLHNQHILEIQHIPNAQLCAPTPRTAFHSTIDEPRTDITILIKQAHGELMQLLAFFVHYLEKIAVVLEPQTAEYFHTLHGSKYTEDRVG